MKHQNLILTLAVHDFRTQYMDSVLGFFWSWIKPLILAGIYVFIFSSVVSSSDPLTGNPVNFGLYVFAGMLPWFVLQESLQRSTNVLIDYAHLIRHHAMPLYILPLHLVVSATGSGIMAICVYFVVKSILSGLPDYHALLLLVLLPMQILFITGLSLLVSTVTVFIRDIAHLTAAMLTIWFFSSPIVFPLEKLPVFLQSPWFNPLVSMTQIYRDILLFQRIPSVDTLCAFAFFTTLSLLIGFFFYQRTHREIVDWV